jgi:hypothetical protein
MPIRARCSDCDKGYAVDDRHAGRRLKCKACGAVVEVPATSSAAAPASAPASARTPRPAAAPARPAASRPAQRPQPAAQSEDPFGNMDALLSLESGGTVAEEPPPLAPPPLPPAGRRAAAAAPSGQVAEAPAYTPPRPVSTLPKRHPNWKPPGQQKAGFSMKGAGMVIPIGAAVLALVFVIGLISDGFKPAATMILILVGGLMILAGGLGCLITAFRESVACGLMYMFVPFGIYALYYIFTRLEETKVYIALYVAGFLCVGGAVVLVPKDHRRGGDDDDSAMARPALVVMAPVHASA